jgi:hypothetical protein
MCGKKTFSPIAEIEAKVKEILERYDMGDKTQISLKEFQSLVSKDQSILQLLKSYQLINSDDLREVMEQETDVVECDSDIDEEIEVRTRCKHGESVARTASSNKMVNLVNDPGEKKRVIRLDESKKLFANPELIPLVFKDFRPDTAYPGFAVEPIHVYGFRGFDMRNTIRIDSVGDLVSIAGTTAWVLDPKTNKQAVYYQHLKEVGCLAIFENYVATGEIGPEPSIHIWQSINVKLMFTLRGLLKEGIVQLCFSNDGKRLAALEAGPNQTLVIFNFSLLLSSRHFNFNEHVIAVRRAPSRVTKSNPGHLPHGLRL